MPKGFFLTLEGTDGVGKTTHARMLKSWLLKKGYRVLLTREPGGGRTSEKIRRLLLDPKMKMENLTELFLYEAARIEHVQKIIRPALARGTVVVCDRFTDATLAYQGDARGLDKNQIEMLNRVATGGLQPNLTVLLDLPARDGLRKARARKPGMKADRLEKEGLAFQKKVRAGYQRLARRHPGRIRTLRVQPRVEDTQELIRAQVSRRLPR